jgi:membrane protease YdiL (CAAX protease family)
MRTDTTNGRIAFEGGFRTLVAFAAAFAAVVAVWVPLTAAVEGSSAWAQLAVEVGKFLVVLLAVLAILRVEGVGLAELGLTRRHLGAALAAFCLLWVGMNFLGAGIAALTDNRWALRFVPAPPEGAPKARAYAPLPATWLVLLGLEFLLVGPIEELAFRGYLQSKVISVLGGTGRASVTAGVVVASLVFGALHTPAALVAGQSAAGVLGAALLPTVTALLFGALYEATGNLAFVALLHAFGNSWPIVVNWQYWSGNALLAFWAGAVVVYLGAAFVARRWSVGEGTPVTGVGMGRSEPA